MWNQRSWRARFLAEKYPASREVLTFYSGLAEWQGELDRELRKNEGQAAMSPATVRNRAAYITLRHVFPSLLDFVSHAGPQILAEAARALDASRLDQLFQDYWESPGDFSPRQFFARVVLQPYAAMFPEGLDCPWCRHAPQAGCLLLEGNGLALQLVCGLCLRRRAFPRARCPVCGESSESRLAIYTAEELPHLRLQACDTCQGYLQIADLSRDPAAIPEVDELSGLPLDLWALDHGYQKLQPNLAGI